MRLNPEHLGLISRIASSLEDLNNYLATASMKGLRVALVIRAEGGDASLSAPIDVLGRETVVVSRPIGISLDLPGQ